MDYLIVLKILGTVLSLEALLMIPSVLISTLDKSYDMNAFIISFVITLLVGGLILQNINIKGHNMKKREAFASVAICWLFMSLFGALPYYLSGACPNFTDALFESASGFTTTGASIFTNVETLPRSLLFWRSFTLWIGGMGVLVFTLSLATNLGFRSIYLMQAESAGLYTGKLVPKLSHTARILYRIYSLMTLFTIILFIIEGMPVFDAFIHAFGAAGTGGFSNQAMSIGSYNNVSLEWATAILMYLFGINFSLYFMLYRKDFKAILHNEELKIYSVAVIAAIVIISIDITAVNNSSFADSLRDAAFQVTSVITTTGYASTDINMWPMLSKIVILIFMFTGACSGSTSGGVKFIRLIVLYKAALYEINHIIHPNSVQTVKINGKIISDETVRSVMTFFFIYITLIFASLLILSLDNLSFFTTFTAVVASISNMGSGFEAISPLGNFSHFSSLSKVTMTLLMIIGRLEVIPIIALFSPSMWNKQ